MKVYHGSSKLFETVSLSGVYAKSETSSASELEDEFRKYALSGESYPKAETSSAEELSEAFGAIPSTIGEEVSAIVKQAIKELIAANPDLVDPWPEE